MIKKLWDSSGQLAAFYCPGSAEISACKYLPDKFQCQR